MLTSFLSGGRAERRGEDERWRRVIVAIGYRALCVIGIMGWFSGGSDAFDAVQNETGAKFTSVCFFGKFKTYICIRSYQVNKNKQKQ